MLNNIFPFLKRNKTIILLLLISFTIRILFSLDNAKSLFIDIEVYKDTALKILQSGIFSIGTYNAPGYPFFIAGIFKLFGTGYLYAYIVQSILGALSTLLIYFIGKNVINQRIGKISAAISLLYWPLTLYSGILLSETLFIFLLLLGVYTFLKGMDSGRAVYFCVCAVSFALSTLTRSINLLFVLIIPLAYYVINYKNYKTVLKNSIIFILLFCMTLSPWVIRNYIMFKEIIPVDSLGGVNLYIGNNERSNGLFINVAGDKVYKVSSTEIEGLNPLIKAAVRDAKMRKAAVSYIVHHPGHFMELTMVRAALFIIFDFKEFDWVIATYMNKNHLFHFNFLKLFMYYCDIVFLVLAYPGILNLSKNKKGKLLLGFVFYYFAITSVFYISSRYTLPIMPFMSIAAALSVERIVNLTAKVRSVKSSYRWFD